MSAKNWIKGKLRALILMCKEKEIIAVPKLYHDNKILEGKIALITGGSSGIGAAIAQTFVNCGAKVIITGTNEKHLDMTLNKIGETNVRKLIWNVRDVKNMSDKLEEALALFPEHRIDILVNSAGLVNHHTFFDMTEEEYDAIMETNTKGTYFMCQTIANYMIKHKIKGHILNVASSSARRPAWTPYQLSKWSVRGMTMGLADILLPYGIIVNAITPGPVATPMLNRKEGDTLYNPSSPSGRYGLPSEIAELAAFMVSDNGNLIVGDTFFITGGSGVITLHH